MKDLYEIRITDITAPRLKEEIKINVGQCKKMLSEFEPSDFESFILEWLKFCRYRNEPNTKLYRIGATGDEGIDVYISRESTFEVVQCKRYKNVLTLPMIRRIIAKILWYLFIDNDGYPSRIYISSIKGLNSGAAKFASNCSTIKKEVIDNIETDLSSLSIKYNDTQINDYAHFLNSYSFDNIEITDIDDVIQEYYRSDMAGFRFSNKRYEFERVEPDSCKISNQIYVEKIKFLLADESQAFLDRAIGEAKVEYYSALQLEATCNYLFGNNIEFDKILKNIKTSVNNELLKRHADNREKYLSVRERAIETNIDNSYLSYELHIVDNTDKCGACHILTNEGDIVWDD